MIIQKALLGDFYVRRTIGKNVVNKHNVMQNLKITKQKKNQTNKKPEETPKDHANVFKREINHLNQEFL